ncbi:MAG: prolyl oligopeptidase family serine peptidase [Lentisphaeraceae bacterium]|nr:prolyl oligopeptidase family serine peptidase [Lentisphaeraceae bacterium]
MKIAHHFFTYFILLTLVGFAQDFKDIPRKVPPKGIVIDQARATSIKGMITKLKEHLTKLSSQEKAEVDVFIKALDFAFQNNEFYKKDKDLQKAEKLVKEAFKRLQALKGKKTPWQISAGKTVRAFYSEIDDSPQPYILEIPKGLDLSKPQSLIIWLHGRGDKVTDMHFMANGLNNKLKFPEQKAITVHPLGRQCIGYKSAGETDVLEVLKHVSEKYKIDENRIALMGFSMGGAGAWHLGAHYAEKWAIVHPGAGFAETKEYNKIKKEDYPTWYEQKLWGLYDIPAYARNFLNVPLIAYSGEVDKQIQAAQVMEKTLKRHGHILNHVIGPKMGHKYDPPSMKAILKTVDKALKNGRNAFPHKVFLQTQTLRYPSMHWLTIEGLDQHWTDSRVNAELKTPMQLIVSTKNISKLTVDLPWPDKKSFAPGFEVIIDGASIKLEKNQTVIKLSKQASWLLVDDHQKELRKKPYLQGPIYDAFQTPFLVVTPTGNSSNTKVDKWVEFEIKHLVKRWRELFRGNIRIKKDSEVTKTDIANFNLILWGSPESNSLIKRLISKTPISWSETSLKVNNKTYSTDKHIPAFIYPNSENPDKYIVINSDPTFRENHDRTNSLQNPKLPDWVVFDLSQMPDGNSAGKVVDVNFFDENWQFKK